MHCFVVLLGKTRPPIRPFYELERAMALKEKPLKPAPLGTPGHAALPADDVVKLTFNVPKATRQKWKQAALNRQMTVTDLIAEAMDKHLA